MTKNDMATLRSCSKEQRGLILDEILLDETYTYNALRAVRIEEYGGREAYDRIMAERAREAKREAERMRRAYRKHREEYAAYERMMASRARAVDADRSAAEASASRRSCGQEIMTMTTTRISPTAYAVVLPPPVGRTVLQRPHLTRYAYGLWPAGFSGEVVGVIVDAGTGTTEDDIRAALTVTVLDPVFADDVSACVSDHVWCEMDLLRADAGSAARSDPAGG